MTTIPIKSIPIKEKKPRDGKITWGELKRLAEQAGIQDGDEIDAIDISWGTIEDVNCFHDEDFGWQIRM